MPSLYSTRSPSPGKKSDDGLCFKDCGNVSASFSLGFASPNYRSAMAPPAACLPKYASSTAFASLSQGITMGEPLLSTTTTLGWAEETAVICSY